MSRLACLCAALCFTGQVAAADIRQACQKIDEAERRLASVKYEAAILPIKLRQEADDMRHDPLASMADGSRRRDLQQRSQDAENVHSAILEAHLSLSHARIYMGCRP